MKAKSTNLGTLNQDRIMREKINGLLAGNSGSVVVEVLGYLMDKVEEATFNKPVLNLSEAARYIYVSEASLRAKVRSNLIPCSRPVEGGSGRLYFKRDDLDNYMLQNYCPSSFTIDQMASNYCATKR